MDALKVMVNHLFKESFYEKRKKKINVLTVFSIFHKSGVKKFLKKLLTIVLRALVSMT